jgi:hypothetical protein
MGYRKLVDKDEFYSEVPGPVEDNNHDGRGDNPQVPGDGQGGSGTQPGPAPDGDGGNRGGARFP